MYRKILVGALSSLLLFCFSACLKEDVKVLGDDPLALRVETDPQGNQFLQWNPLNISRFRRYDIQVSTDSNFFVNVITDTSLFQYNDTRVRVNLSAFPLNRWQYFRVVASTIDNKMLFSKIMHIENIKVSSIPIHNNINRVYISPDSKYLICQSNNVLFCLDMESKQITGNAMVSNGFSSGSEKFSFSTKNGDSYFLFCLAPHSSSKIITFKLPGLVPVSNFTPTSFLGSPFIAIDETDYIVLFNASSWPSLQLVNGNTGAVLNELRTNPWVVVDATLAFKTTDIAKREFIHQRSDSLIKYVITNNGKIQTIKGVINQIPGFSNSSNNRVVQELKEGKYFNVSNYAIGQQNSAGIHSSDLSISFDTPNSTDLVHQQILYSVLSKDGNFIYTIYQGIPNFDTRIRKTLLDDRSIVFDKSLGNINFGEFTGLLERPEGLSLFTKIGSELVFVKLEI